MKLLVESAMIFFGTLMAAGLVALGEPRHHFEPPSVPGGTVLDDARQVVAAAPKLPNDAATSQSNR